MKKIIIWVVVVIFALSLTFVGIGCKPSAIEEAVEEVAEAVEEAAEEVEEAVEEEVVVAEDDDGLTFVFLGHIIHPFTTGAENGVIAVGDAFGYKTVVQTPEGWDPAMQTQIIDSLLAAGEMDVLIVMPTDKDALIPALQRAHDSGVPVITPDTFIGDGIYTEGHPVTFPIAYIGSDNFEGGTICGEELAKAIGYEGKVYIQNVTPGISSTDERAAGFETAISNYPDIEIVGLDYNENDIAKAQAQTTAVFQREPDLKGIFGTNGIAAAGAGLAVNNANLQDEIVVIGFDADATTYEDLATGTIDLALAQKPYEMGLLAGLLGLAYINGVPDLPTKLATGFVVITKENFEDPEYVKWFYK